jgi:5S rRNA maturation endonuclease (ribonuclease M5)
MSKKSKFNKRLLVEGKDDFHVIAALCEKFQIAENSAIQLLELLSLW